MSKKTREEAELGQALAEHAKSAPDPYREYTEPGPNPGGSAAWQGVIEALKYEPALVRNMAAGPFVISTCQCPKCGELFVHYVQYKHHSHNNAYSVCLEPDEEPLCHRCLYATAWPAPTAELVEAMAEIRWRYDAHLAACEVASQQSQKQQREAFLRAYDAFWLHGPALLVGLEHIFGDQLKAGVVTIERGASGVEESGPAEAPVGGPAEGSSAGDRQGADRQGADSATDGEGSAAGEP